MLLLSWLDRFPDYARDIKLNLDQLLNPQTQAEALVGMTSIQVTGVALACAYAVKDMQMVEILKTDFQVTPDLEHAAQGAAVIMAMNNVYYRSMHLIEDKEISGFPARLRMNIIGKPGIAKGDFELMCLAVSAISGCGKCLNAHIHEVKKQNISNEGVHSAIRLAAVMQAAKQVMSFVL